MKNKRNIFSEWINKIRNRNRPNEGIYYVSQRLRRTAKVVIPELTEINNNINNLTTNTAKKNESNTFTQNQKITGQLEIRKDADAVKIGNANDNSACYVEFFNGNNRRGYVGHPRSSNNSFEINNGDNEIKLVGSAINVNSKRIVNVASPTANSDAVNKGYVDNRSSELTNEINSIKQKNTEQDSEITNIKQKNTQQDNRITTLENKPSGGVDWTQIQEVRDGNAIRLKALLQLVGINPELPAPTVYSMLAILPQDIRLINDYDGTTNTLKLGRDGLSLNNQPIIPIVARTFYIRNVGTWNNNTTKRVSTIPANSHIIGFNVKAGHLFVGNTFYRMDTSNQTMATDGYVYNWHLNHKTTDGSIYLTYSSIRNANSVLNHNLGIGGGEVALTVFYTTAQPQTYDLNFNELETVVIGEKQ